MIGKYVLCSNTLQQPGMLRLERRAFTSKTLTICTLVNPLICNQKVVVKSQDSCHYANGKVSNDVAYNSPRCSMLPECLYFYVICIRSVHINNHHGYKKDQKTKRQCLLGVSLLSLVKARKAKGKLDQQCT
jgi:hypothetical protein